jgi:hypothetical protein
MYSLVALSDTRFEVLKDGSYQYTLVYQRPATRKAAAYVESMNRSEEQQAAEEDDGKPYRVAIIHKDGTTDSFEIPKEDLDREPEGESLHYVGDGTQHMVDEHGNITIEKDDDWVPYDDEDDQGAMQ